MHKNRLGALCGAVLLVGALGLAGCASASTNAVVGNAADGTARTNAVNSPSTHIIVYSIDSDGPDLRAIVSGAIGDYGPAITVYPNGTIDPDHTSELELKLTRGSFRLNIKRVDQAFAAAASHEPIYPGSCSDFISITGTAPIVAGSGTGSYRGIAGRFHLTTTLDEVEAKSCRPGTPASFRQQIISLAGSGTVTR